MNLAGRGATEENHITPKSVYPVSWLSFEPGKGK